MSIRGFGNAGNAPSCTGVQRAVTDQCDAEGIGAYLESSDVKNVPLYTQHGFRILKTVTLRGKGGDAALGSPDLEVRVYVCDAFSFDSSASNWIPLYWLLGSFVLDSFSVISSFFVWRLLGLSAFFFFDAMDVATLQADHVARSTATLYGSDSAAAGSQAVTFNAPPLQDSIGQCKEKERERD